MRYSIDTLLYSHNDVKRKEVCTANSKFEIMKKIKNITESLLVKKRTPMDIDMERHEWTDYDKNDVLEKGDIYHGRGIFPVQHTLKLHPINLDAQKKLIEHCNDLYNRYAKVFQ